MIKMLMLIFKNQTCKYPLKIFKVNYSDFEGSLNSFKVF